MLDFTETQLKQLVIHHVGNANENQEVQYSKSTTQTTEEVNEVLLHYFLSGFSAEHFHSFAHESDLNMNYVFNYAAKIFENPESFFDHSINLARHLYENSIHPKIQSGEFYAVFFENCVVEDEITDALGLFKTENKDTFLKVFPQNDQFSVDSQKGINIKKLDKGCLIFNTEKDLGYKVLVVDNVNKGKDAQYWRERFLQTKEREDNFYHTRNYMELCKGFVQEVYNEENNIERTDQIDMLNQSAKYFTEKEKFENHDFKEEVMGGDPNLINAFEQYKDQVEERNEVKFSEEFEVSPEAVKSNKRKFKSVLKLDKNFHIYIHGDRNCIEKGFDQNKNMNFYKIYYQEEK